MVKREGASYILLKWYSESFLSKLLLYILLHIRENHRTRWNFIFIWNAYDQTNSFSNVNSLEFSYVAFNGACFMWFITYVFHSILMWCHKLPVANIASVSPIEYTHALICIRLIFLLQFNRNCVLYHHRRTHIHLKQYR